MSIPNPNPLYSMLVPFRSLYRHQAKIQQALLAKFNPGEAEPTTDLGRAEESKYAGYLNVASTWLPLHFGINMLDNVIEECVEAKRLIRLRKWWTKIGDLEANYAQLADPASDLRKELACELADIFIQFINALIYFGITPDEFMAHLADKMKLNDPDSEESTIGDRS